QQRHQFTTGILREGKGLDGTLLEEALHDNTQTPVDEQVCFRLDFPAWLLTRTDRDHRVVRDLMRGGKNAGRFQEIRHHASPYFPASRDFYQDWGQVCGEWEEEGRGSPCER